MPVHRTLDFRNGHARRLKLTDKHGGIEELQLKK